MSYAIHKDESKVEAALRLAKGCYQRALIMGREALSGATLSGKAASYGAHYARSRRNLMARLRAAGLAEEQVGAHGKRFLVVG